MMTGKRKWTHTLFALALLAVFVSGGALLAGKGGKKPPKDDPPPPPPAGTIYFEQKISDYPLADILGMNTDGSGKFAALPVINVSEVNVTDPSSRLYDGRPIWLAAFNLAELYPGHTELFAIRPNADGTGIEEVQITNFSPAIRMDFAGAFWSNDGQDTFVSFVGWVGESPDFERCLHRLWVSGDELALAFEFPQFWTPFGAEDVETVLCADDLFSHHDWSPDGTKVVYFIGGGRDMHVWDTTGTPSDTFLASSANVAHWSPDGTRIAFSGITTGRKAKRGILTINPDGSNATLLIADKSSRSFSNPHWSPDGAHLALFVGGFVQVQGANQFVRDIARIKSDGSGLTFLTDDLDPFVSKELLGWR